MNYMMKNAAIRAAFFDIDEVVDTVSFFMSCDCFQIAEANS